MRIEIYSYGSLIGNYISNKIQVRCINTGMMTILDNHESFLAAIDMFILDDNVENHSNGYIRFKDNKCIIFLERDY